MTKDKLKELHQLNARGDAYKELDRRGLPHTQANLIMLVREEVDKLIAAGVLYRDAEGGIHKR